MFEFERKHLRVDHDFDYDNGYIVVYLETWFDVDEKFETHTKDTESWVNFYAFYNPILGDLRLEYILEDMSCEFIPEPISYSPIGNERELIVSMIEDACMEYNNCSCRDMVIRIKQED